MGNRVAAGPAQPVSDVDSRPSKGGFVITKSDTVIFREVRGIYVGGQGDVRVRFPRTNDIVTFSAVPAGTILPVFADMVYETGTSASSLVGLY
jgi:hypothetical protein